MSAKPERIILVTAAVVLLGALGTADGLKCFQCANMETDSDSKLLKELFKGNSDPRCKSPDLDMAVECPNDGKSYKCGYADASIIYHTLFGKISMKVQNRDCVETTAEDDCYTGNDDLKGFLNEILSFAFNFELDGKVCYCSEDYCAAECGPDSWKIGTLCLKKWQMILAGIASLIVTGALLSCCCCCCCCCRCCKSSQPQGRVIMTTPAVVTSSSTSNYVRLDETHNISGTENPGYNGAGAWPGQVQAGGPSVYTGAKHRVV